MRTSSILLLIFVVAGPALAGMSPVGSSGETNHVQILNHLYAAVDGSFTPAHAGAVFGDTVYASAGGGVVARRIDDFGLGTLDLSTGTPGSGADQYWSNGVVDVRARARFAGYSQSFGFDPGADGGAYTPLLTVSGSGFNVSGSARNVSLGHLVAFVRGGQNGPHYSVDSLNADRRDHLLTYEISGLGGKTWLLLWEDLKLPGGDADYNDLAVDVTLVPAPGAVVLGLFGLGGVLLKRRPA